MKYRFELRMRLESLANVREHWAVRAKRARKHVLIGLHAARCALSSFGTFRARSFIVRLTRVGRRNMDGDNLVISFKSIRDGIARGLGIDDGDPRLAWRYAQRRGDDAVVIEIETRGTRDP